MESKSRVQVPVLLQLLRTNALGKNMNLFLFPAPCRRAMTKNLTKSTGFKQPCLPWVVTERRIRNPKRQRESTPLSFI